MRIWPSLRHKTIEGISIVLDYMISERQADRREWLDLPNQYMSGRKVGKVPSSSTDTADSRIGDFNHDGSYLYICVDNSGSAVWRRISLSSW